MSVCKKNWCFLLPVLDPHELVMLLTSACLFTTGLSVSKIFDVPYRIVFEALTKKCGSISKQNDPVTWKWLIENDLQGNIFNTCRKKR